MSKRAPKKKQDLDSDFSDSLTIQKPRRSAKPNVNENIKSQLLIIIDILSNNGEELDERILRHNVNTSLKHLKNVIDAL
jgi:hypothetical protein